MDTNNHIDKKDGAILRNEDIMRAEEDGWQPDSPPLFRVSRALPIAITLLSASLWYIYSEYRVVIYEMERMITLDNDLDVVSACKIDARRLLIGVHRYYSQNHTMPDAIFDFKGMIPPKHTLNHESRHSYNDAISIINSSRIDSSSTFVDKNPELDIFDLPMIYQRGGQVDKEFYDPYYESILLLCSIKILPFDKHNRIVKEYDSKINIFVSFRYPILILIVFIGIAFTIRNKNKKFGILSIITIIVSLTVSVALPFLNIMRYISSNQYYGSCYMRFATHSSSLLSIQDRYDLIKEMQQNNEIDTETATKANECIYQLEQLRLYNWKLDEEEWSD